MIDPILADAIIKPLNWGYDHIRKEWWANPAIGPNYVVRADGNWKRMDDVGRVYVSETGSVESGKKEVWEAYKAYVLSALQVDFVFVQ